jgi:DNA polymerase I-like protein with 3'-5' exonuclease and polymerase domains
MSNPNMQQIPSRDPILGPMIRSLFLPDDGKQWASIDFSQQEPRLAVHYADAYGRSINSELTGVAEIVEAYNTNPDTDFHTMVAEMAGLPRKQAKAVGLGIIYGMGAKKMADDLDISVDEAKAVIAQFNKTLPFLKQLNTGVQNRLNDPRSSGSIRSIRGRKCRFDTWEPTTFGMNKAMKYDEAIAAYGPTTRLQRAMTYKALNRLIQASAADMTKAAWLACCKAGHVPMLQVHDELAFSVQDVDEARALSGIMSSAVPLCVPNKCDIDIGPSWGEAVGVDG